VEAGARILPFCHRGARIGPESGLAPRAPRVRQARFPAHVGNFVETKNAKLGEA
jgi:bifunctional N-acetylglucosamine-1-phosphate-uridyltransferase/glucosamine-1-phosphate-acetyltransferase GlmU-like protein